MNKKIRNIRAFIVAWILFCITTGCNTKENQFSDRAMFNFKGEVSSCKTTEFPCTVKNGEVVIGEKGWTSVQRFSKEGLLTLLNDDTPLGYDKNGFFIPNEIVDSLKRNEKGQLTYIMYKESEDGFLENYGFQYNERGLLKTLGRYNEYTCWESNYTYNDEGQIIEERCEEPGGIENKYIYEYKKMDKYGNWIIRISRNVTGEHDFYVEREIEYYKEK